MLKRTALLFILLCLLICAASACAAGTFVPVELADCSVSPMPGVVLDSRTSYQDGRIVLYIDCADSDFSQLVASSYSSSDNMVYISGTISAPDGESAYRFHSTDTKNEQSIWDNIDAWQNSSGISGTQCSWSLDIGRYDPDKQLFLPRDTEDYPHSFIVGWQNDEGTLVPHRMILEVHYTSAEPQDASLSMLPEENLVAGSSEASTGRIVHACSADSASVTTHFTLPKIADNQSGWYATYSVTGSADSPVTLTPDSSGVYALETALVPGTAAVTETTYLIEQFDSSDCLRARYSLAVCVEQGDPQFWPVYIDSVKPFDPDRLHCSLSEQIPGLSVTYENGHLRFRTDADVFAPASQGNLADVWGVVDITPPPLAVKMGYAGTADDIIYGNNGSSLPSPSVYETISWETFGAGAPFFMEVPYENKAHRYYTTSLEQTGKYSGAVSFYFWYKEGETEPFLVEYIVRTHDPVSFDTSTPVIDDESALKPENEGKPFLVLQDKGSTQKTLSARLYPTGENKHYYEIRVLNPNGKEVPLNNAACRLYLPYPPGYDETSAQLLSFSICHYNKQGSKVRERYSVEDGSLTLTENGLCISVRDFSPFTVEWTEAPAAQSPALPQTGDSSQLALWAALAALVLALLPALSRRRA